MRYFTALRHADLLMLLPLMPRASRRALALLRRLPYTRCQRHDAYIRRFDTLLPRQDAMVTAMLLRGC